MKRLDGLPPEVVAFQVIGWMALFSIAAVGYFTGDFVCRRRRMQRALQGLTVRR